MASSSSGSGSNRKQSERFLVDLIEIGTDAYDDVVSIHQRSLERERSTVLTTQDTTGMSPHSTLIEYLRRKGIEYRGVPMTTLVPQVRNLPLSALISDFERQWALFRSIVYKYNQSFLSRTKGTDDGMYEKYIHTCSMDTMFTGPFWARVDERELLSLPLLVSDGRAPLGVPIDGGRSNRSMHSRYRIDPIDRKIEHKLDAPLPPPPPSSTASDMKRGVREWYRNLLESNVSTLRVSHMQSRVLPIVAAIANGYDRARNTGARFLDGENATAPIEINDATDTPKIIAARAVRHDLMISYRIKLSHGLPTFPRILIDNQKPYQARLTSVLMRPAESSVRERLARVQATAIVIQRECHPLSDQEELKEREEILAPERKTLTGGFYYHRTNYGLSRMMLDLELIRFGPDLVLFDSTVMDPVVANEIVEMKDDGFQQHDELKRALEASNSQYELYLTNDARPAWKRAMDLIAMRECNRRMHTVASEIIEIVDNSADDPSRAFDIVVERLQENSILHTADVDTAYQRGLFQYLEHAYGRIDQIPDLAAIQYQSGRRQYVALRGTQRAVRTRQAFLTTCVTREIQLHGNRYAQQTSLTAEPWGAWVVREAAVTDLRRFWRMVEGMKEKINQDLAQGLNEPSKIVLTAKLDVLQDPFSWISELGSSRVTFRRYLGAVVALMSLFQLHDLVMFHMRKN